MAKNVEVVSQSLASPLTGDQKLQGAAPSVAQIVLDSALMAGHSVAQPALFQSGVAKVTSGIVDIVNSRNPDPLTAPRPAPPVIQGKAV